MSGGFLIHKCSLYSYKKTFKSYVLAHKNILPLSSIYITPSELFRNSSDLTWLDENTEIVFKGVLYDIVEMKNINGKVVLNVVSDNQESEIQKNFALFFATKKDSSSKEPFELLKDFFELEYINTNFSFKYLKKLTKINNCRNDLQLPNMFFFIDSPPPDLIFCNL